MPLTKQDLSRIKKIMQDELGVATRSNVENAVETLAVIVHKAFTGVEKQFEALDKRLELLDKRIGIIESEIRHVNARLDTIEHDIAEIRKHFVYRDEFEEVIARLAVVEKKLGIKAGK